MMEQPYEADELESGTMKAVHLSNSEAVALSFSDWNYQKDLELLKLKILQASPHVS